VLDVCFRFRFRFRFTNRVPASSLTKGEAEKMKLKIPAGVFHAYLSDCDGTIADSMPLHCMEKRAGRVELCFSRRSILCMGRFPGGGNHLALESGAGP
jgi:hypothetical protein